jgi:hypothetical protein
MWNSVTLASARSARVTFWWLQKWGIDAEVVFADEFDVIRDRSSNAEE